MKKVCILFVCVLVLSMNLLASNKEDVKKFDAQRIELGKLDKAKFLTIEMIRTNIIRINNKDFFIRQTSEYLANNSKGEKVKVVCYGLQGVKDNSPIKQIRITSEYVVINENEVYKR